MPELLAKLYLLRFLLFIKDLSALVSSQVLLFADNCLLYRAFHTEADQLELQWDLWALEAWCDTWRMYFNVQQCNVLHMYRGNKPFTQMYTLNNHNISWSHHI